MNSKEVMKGDHILLDKTEIKDDLNVDLEINFKMSGYKNNMENDVTKDLQCKSMNILTIKRDIHIINQKNDLDRFYILDLEKRCVKFVEEFRREESNQLVGVYLKQLRIRQS